MFELIIIICIALYVIGLLADVADKKPGLLYLLALPIAILTLPLKLAGDQLKAERRHRNRKRGRRR